jgi:hypothetical protein
LVPTGTTSKWFVTKLNNFNTPKPFLGLRCSSSPRVR